MGMQQQKGKQSIWKDVKILFSGWSIAGCLLILFAISYAYLIVASGNKWLSLIASLLGSVILFLAFFVRNKKTRVYQSQLTELLKYATTMSFFLRSGKNVFYSLEESKKCVDLTIQQDIEKTIDILQKEARLDTSHFEKYDFPALHQFHRILNIKYEKGGNAEELFGQVLKSMNFEISKRDELYRKKKDIATQIYMLVGIVAIMPLLLASLTYNLYQQFLSYSIASDVIVISFYAAIILNLHALQKKLSDISIRL